MWCSALFVADGQQYVDENAMRTCREIENLKPTRWNSMLKPLSRAFSHSYCWLLLLVASFSNEHSTFQYYSEPKAWRIREPWRYGESVAECLIFAYYRAQSTILKIMNILYTLYILHWMYICFCFCLHSNKKRPRCKGKHTHTQNGKNPIYSI